VPEKDSASSCDFNSVLGGGKFGVHVWTWQFVVSPATELVVVNGSVARRVANGSFGAGRCGASIGEGTTDRMAVGGAPFYLGPYRLHLLNVHKRPPSRGGGRSGCEPVDVAAHEYAVAAGLSDGH
jgi:hypothetical protein